MSSFRFVHVGVAALVAAATITTISLVTTVSAAGPGIASSFIPIVPCRLADTRPGTDHVGDRPGTIGPAESAAFAVWGTNGNCAIPDSATGIATNITAVGPTDYSFLTVYPTDASTRPTTSNLNYGPASPPTPNQVTVAVSATGTISAYNHTGTVDVIIDIVGYYQPATTGTGPQGPPGPAGPAGQVGPVGPAGALPSGRIVFTGQDVVFTDPGSYEYDESEGCVSMPSDIGLLPLTVPSGATITSIVVRSIDYYTQPDDRLIVRLYRTNPGVSEREVSRFTANSTGLADRNLDVSPLAVSSTNVYYLYVTSFGANKFCSADVSYTFS